ncbi:hypothetical protein ACJX0J_035170, partial [Zea mays]
LVWQQIIQVLEIFIIFSLTSIVLMIRVADSIGKLLTISVYIDLEIVNAGQPKQTPYQIQNEGKWEIGGSWRQTYRRT